ncbi:MAG: hypothetical protein PF630_11145 [Gammaproteobacteria bacterium]|jgi:hypothetical protein|nr:hypothetical protein [Gammaproteobacteria bacterium]
MNTLPSPKRSLLTPIAMLLAMLFTSSTVYASGVTTTCELIDTGTPRTFVCSSFGDSADLTSQTWSLTTGGTIIAQGTGFMAAECGGSTNLGYQFIAALSDGMTATGSGNLPCQDGGSDPGPGPGSGCTPSRILPCPAPEAHAGDK